MLLNYQYRAYPGTAQKLELNSWLRIGRYWYNWQLGDRFNWWESNRNAVNSCPLVCALPELRDNPGYYSQKKYLPAIKKDLVKVGHSGELLDFSTVPSQTLQDISKRADLAFNRFIKGDTNGKRSGKPRFKNGARFRTLKIEVRAVDVVRVEKNWLFLTISKLSGWLKVKLHRPLPDGFELKNILLTKKTDGWYCSLAIKDSKVPTFTSDEVIPTWENSLGMDAVLHEDNYLATSEGEKLPALKSFRSTQSKLTIVSQRKAKRLKGSKSRRKLAKRESRIHQKIARARKDHAYKTSHKLVRTGKKVFFHEKLNLKGLTKRNKAKQGEDGRFLPNGQSRKSGLNKSWLDAAFGDFFKTLQYIAEKAGCRVIPVKPEYTSQLLPYKDEFVFTDCSIRKYWDQEYSLWIDRDISAGINIKRVGLGVFPTLKRREGNPVVVASTTSSTLKEVLVVLQRCQKPTL
ncbi:MAG: transposase [Cyanobacteria bacterium J06635_10]